ncbi:MAG: sodium:proton antiporter, partial [bacterium]|nr:sodium:proton antiporter [bacterium]
MEGNFILLFLVLFPMAGALASYLIGRKNKEVRNYFAAAVAIIEFIVMAYLFVTFKETTEFVWKEFCGRGMYLELDGFRVLYILIAGLMWMMTTIFSKEYFAHYRNRNRYYLFTLFTLGATVGVFLSADLFTTFIFFEIM